MDLSRDLLAAWGKLAALSVLAAAVTLLPLPGFVIAGAILSLALIKARLILARYLDLACAPSWLSGATLFFAIWMILAYGLYLIPPFLR